MITPLDIEKSVLKKSKLGGYEKHSVDEFLDRLGKDYETLYKENIELKDKMSVLNDAITQYKSMEDTLRETLITAQTSADDIKKNANEKADNIIKQAELNSSKIIEEANKSVIEIKSEYETLKKEMEIYKSKLSVLINSQLKTLDEL